MGCRCLKPLRASSTCRPVAPRGPGLARLHARARRLEKVSSLVDNEHCEIEQQAHRPASLMACPDCDLLHRRVRTAPQARVTLRCRRCGAVLSRHAPGGRQLTLALAMTGVVLYIVGNAAPLASVDIQGQQTSTTLAGLVLALQQDERPALAAVVMFTLMVAPVLQLASLCWLLLPAGVPQLPRRRGLILARRLLSSTRAWSMIEIFMLGAMVALVKLGEVAVVRPGIALASLAALMLVMAASGDALRGETDFLEDILNPAGAELNNHEFPHAGETSRADDMRPASP